MKGWFFYWAWGGSLAMVLLVITLVAYQALTVPPDFARAVAQSEGTSPMPMARAERPFPLRPLDGWGAAGAAVAQREPGGDVGAFRPPARGQRYLTLLVDSLERERQQDPEHVRTVLRELQRLDAPDPRIYRWLGTEYHRQGDYPAAAAAFERAVELSPNNAPDLFNLATIYLLEERYPRAIRTFNRVIPLQPPFLDDVYAYLGYCLHAMGEEPAARRAWSLSIQLNPDNVVARRYLKSEVTSAGPQADARITARPPPSDRSAATGAGRGGAGPDHP
jgi:tetratricopeptide (TPR) repeat protein